MSRPHTPRCAVREAFTPDQCRLCWLATYDEKYQALWSGEPTPPTPRGGRKVECVHLGAVIDRVGRGCHLCWVRGCAVHGKCTLKEPHTSEAHGSPPTCATCDQYVADE